MICVAAYLLVGLAAWFPPRPRYGEWAFAVLAWPGAFWPALTGGK